MKRSCRDFRSWDLPLPVSTGSGRIAQVLYNPPKKHLTLN